MNSPVDGFDAGSMGFHLHRPLPIRNRRIRFTLPDMPTDGHRFEICMAASNSAMTWQCFVMKHSSSVKLPAQLARRPIMNLTLPWFTPSSLWQGIFATNRALLNKVVPSGSDRGNSGCRDFRLPGDNRGALTDGRPERLAVLLDAEISAESASNRQETLVRLVCGEQYGIAETRSRLVKRSE